MGPFIPPLPVESCVAAFLWITTYLVSTISTTSIIDYICSTVQSNTNHTFYPTVQSESNFYTGTMQEATNSTIGAIRPCVNGTVEHEHFKYSFLVRLGNQLALVVTNKVDIIRDGLSPVFIHF